MTAVGWDEDDDCTCFRCQQPVSALPDLRLPLHVRIRVHAIHRIDTARTWVAMVLRPGVRMR